MRNSRFIGLCPQQPNLYVYSDDGAYIMNASTLHGASKDELR